MKSLEIAQQYFELSNKADLKSIENLLTESSTYSSQNTGVYLGVIQIMKMKNNFYGSFKSLNWDVHSIEEIREGVVLFDFTLTGETLEGEKVIREGIEYVIVYKGKIQHVDVRNKS